MTKVELYVFIYQQYMRSYNFADMRFFVL